MGALDNFDAWNKSLLRFTSTPTEAFQSYWKRLTGIKTPRIFTLRKITSNFVSIRSLSLKKKKIKIKEARNKALKCTSDFARTCDGDVVGRTDSHYVLACTVLNEKRKQIFNIADTARREGWEGFFVTVTQRIGATSATPRSQSPPPRSPIHVCLVFIVRSFYFSIIR